MKSKTLSMIYKTASVNNEPIIDCRIIGSHKQNFAKHPYKPWQPKRHAHEVIKHIDVN